MSKSKEAIIIIVTFLACIFLGFFAIDSLAQSNSTLEMRYPETEKYEGKCEICGAPIVEYREVKNSFYDNGFTLTHDISFSLPTSISAIYKLSFNQTLEVCKDCAEKYEEKFSEKMLSVWISLLIETQDENKDKRKDFELKAKKQKETEIKNKIEELQDDLRELNGEPRKQSKIKIWNQPGFQIKTFSLTNKKR